MASDKAILVRDSLNEMIEGLTKDKNDQEGAILACCVALSVEEVEKYMYHGEFTPSVVPIKDGNGIKVPRIKEEEEEDITYNSDDLIDVLSKHGKLTPLTPFPPFPPIPKWGPPKSSPPGWSADTDPVTESPAFKRLQAKAEIKPVVLKPCDPLDGYKPDDWDMDTMRAFKDANRAVFIFCVRHLIPHFKVQISVATDYLNRMIAAYPDLWGKDVKK